MEGSGEGCCVLVIALFFIGVIAGTANLINMSTDKGRAILVLGIIWAVGIAILWFIRWVAIRPYK